MVAANGGDHFSEKMYEEAEKRLQEEQQQKNVDRETVEQQQYHFSFLPDLMRRVALFQAVLTAVVQENASNENPSAIASIRPSSDLDSLN
ncbi:uncharacterized protein V6R79_023702 [Siganus canaliculatus]